MKKYKIRCPFCGSEVERWEWLLKLKLVFSNQYTHHCTICHKKSTWLYLFHLRHDSTDPTEKLFNKGKLWDDRI